MYWIGGVIAFVSLSIGVEYIFEKPFLDRLNYSFPTEFMLGLLIWISKVAYSIWERGADGTKTTSTVYTVFSIVGLLIGLCKFGKLVYINRNSSYRNLLVYVGTPIITITVQASTGLSTGVEFAVFIGSLLLCSLWKEKADFASAPGKASISMVTIVSGIITTELVYNKRFLSDNLPYYIGLLVVLGLLWIFYRKAIENMQMKLVMKKMKPIGVLLFLFLMFPFFIMFLAAISGGLFLLLLLLYLFWRSTSDVLRYFLAPSFLHYSVNLVFGIVALIFVVWSSKNIWLIFCGDLPDEQDEQDEKGSK